MKTRQEQIQAIEQDWLTNPRWHGVKRPYTAEEVLKLRGSYTIEYTIATEMSKKFWDKLNTQDYVAGLGALTGNQAVQEVDAGLEAIYLSGWQVAADANLSGEMYPDQSLYPANSVPSVVKKINNALLRADQVQSVSGSGNKEYLVPIIADAEAGFGGNLNAFELMKQMIEAGAAGVHFEDQLSSAKKCGHLGGKVLVPTQEAVNKLIAARLAADVLGVPSLIIARTDADAADLLTSDIDDRDKEIRYRRENFRRILRGKKWSRTRHRQRTVLCSLCRSYLDGNFKSRPGTSQKVCRRNSCEIPGKNAGL